MDALCEAVNGMYKFHRAQIGVLLGELYNLSSLLKRQNGLSAIQINPRFSECKNHKLMLCAET